MIDVEMLKERTENELLELFADLVYDLAESIKTQSSFDGFAIKPEGYEERLKWRGVVR